MKKEILFAFVWMLMISCTEAQTAKSNAKSTVTNVEQEKSALTEKLTNALATLEKDASMQHAIIGICVLDAQTGKLIFAKNEQMGLAPASTQKVVTSLAAMELLGNDFKFKTELLADGEIKNGVLNGNLILKGNGDPSFGSWRFNSTKSDEIYAQFFDAMTKAGIKKITKDICLYANHFETQATPKGWVWEDIGNYYGAGAWSLNWHENQYDIAFQPNQVVGGLASVANVDPAFAKDDVTFINEMKTGEAGSGDNGYIFFPPNSNVGFLRGSIPAGQKYFTISGAMPDGSYMGLKQFANYCSKRKLAIDGLSQSNNYQTFLQSKNQFELAALKNIFTYNSPSFDSLNYWFLHKSINLYGEAFVKAIALQKNNFGRTDSGVAVIKSFWQQKGIDPTALNIIDGSGLSPQNRVTAYALAQVMQYARSKNNYATFVKALPDMNGMKMKDGFITGVRSFTGYAKSKSGREFSFAFIVNNFDGNPGVVREKMWKILDLLK
jgi:serine-type D-Ala-D-Ala carboxypeptidase/endopeptidase (penicillin-binding protein 4)